MPGNNKLIGNILSDMKVDLSELFDGNFETKSFFGERWKPRKNPKAKGSLLLVTGKMRRSIRGIVRGNGVCFTSPLPYTDLHNRGGKVTQHVLAHSRLNRRAKKTVRVRAHTRNIIMPRRQFIGDHARVKSAIHTIVTDNITEFFDNLEKQIK